MPTRLEDVVVPIELSDVQMCNEILPWQIQFRHALEKSEIGDRDVSTTSICGWPEEKEEDQPESMPSISVFGNATRKLHLLTLPKPVESVVASVVPDDPAKYLRKFVHRGGTVWV